MGFAIRVAIEELCGTVSKQTKLKIKNVVGRYQIIKVTLKKMRGFCGFDFFEEDDIQLLKFYEAYFESFFQLILAIFYFLQTRRSSAGNSEEDNLFTSDNAIILSSMLMSVGSIAIAYVSFAVTVAKLKYGKDFYKRLKSMNGFDIFILIVGPIVLIIFPFI